MIAAVMVTLPAATPVAEHPVSVTEVVATSVFEDVQVQLAVEPEAPPLTWIVNTTASPISTSADAGNIETTSGDGSTSRLAVAFDVWPPFMIAAVMVTLPTVTPVAEQPESVTEVVATPVSEEAQVQLAVEPEAPPLTWSVNTTVSAISTSADAGDTETTNGGGGGGSTSRLAVAFDVWPPFMIAAVMVTLPAATPVAEHPEPVTEVLATSVFEDVQVQLAVEPEAPPLTWSVNTTVSAISTSADAGAIETTSGGVVGVVGLLLSDPEQPTRTETANTASGIRGILAAPRSTIRRCVKGEATYVSADK